MKLTIRGEEWIRSRRKRLFDLCLCGIITPAAFCICIVSLAAIWLFDGRPLFYTQTRIGRDGTLFTLHKLRTMPVGSDTPTSLGRLLSILGADETPQILYDIWRGKMAVIGIRPLVPKDFLKMRTLLGAEKYAQWHKAYNACRPGWMGSFSQPSRKYIAQSEEYLQARYMYDVNYYKTACFGKDVATFFLSLTMWCTNPVKLRNAFRDCFMQEYE